MESKVTLLFGIAAYFLSSFSVNYQPKNEKVFHAHKNIAPAPETEINLKYDSLNSVMDSLFIYEAVRIKETQSKKETQQVRKIQSLRNELQRSQVEISRLKNELTILKSDTL